MMRSCLYSALALEGMSSYKHSFSGLESPEDLGRQSVPVWEVNL